MSGPGEPSPRQAELLELAYQYVLVHGLADMSLRPLARAIGSSPRVLLYLFGSKDGLVRALLDRSRRDELAAIKAFREDPGSAGLIETAQQVWEWLSDPAHRYLLGLWVEAYGRSLADPGGPWAGFAAQTVQDWLGLLAARQAPALRDSDAGTGQRTAVLAVLRGAMLDLLATRDTARTGQAVTQSLQAMRSEYEPLTGAERFSAPGPATPSSAGSRRCPAPPWAATDPRPCAP